MLKQRLNKFIRNPKKALFTLALPTVIAMVVQTMYNVVDTAFVGRIGVDAIAALTFALPIFFILIAINNGISVGMSAKIAQFFGAKNKTAAENVALHGLLISLVVALFVFIAGLFLIKPLFILTGASGNVLDLALSYMYIVLASTFFMYPAFAFHGIFTSQGDTKTPMILQITALSLNIVLDYIFIFIFNLGVPGAAYATALSFVFNFTLGFYYIRKKSLLHIHLKNFHFSPWIIKKIFFIGAPASLLMLLISIYVMAMNRIMISFSSTYVAVMGVAFRLENVVIMPVIGLSIALLTLVGMFYGARRYDLVRKIIFYSLKIGLVFTFVGCLVFFILPYPFLRIFTPDQTLLALSINFLRIDIWVIPLLATVTLINRSMQGLGTGLPGLVSNIVRVIVVAIPLSYLLVFVAGWNYLAVAVADVIGGLIAAAVALIWIIIKLKKLHLLDSNGL